MQANGNGEAIDTKQRKCKNVLSSAGAPLGTFPVIDPCSKKLFVPLGALQETRALHREGVPSLCRIFLEGRCRQGVNCFQAHADVATVVQLRAAALAEPSCCIFHGAPRKTANIPCGLSIAMKSDEASIRSRLTLPQVQVTNGLLTLFAAQGVNGGSSNSEVVVPVSSMCRLHGEGPCCRFGDECNFIHVCRDIIPVVLNDADSSPLSSEVVGDSSEAVAPPPAPLAISAVTQLIPLSASADANSTSPIWFDPLVLETTAPAHSEAPLGVSPVMNRSFWSFCSTPTGLIWRHNPYGSSRTSSVIET